MSDLHPARQLGDGAILLDQVLNHVTMTLLRPLKPGGSQTFYHQFVDSRPQKKPEIAKIQILHNHGCV